MSDLCEHETFKDVCGICHRDGVITRLRAEVERLRAALGNIRHKRREMDMGDLSADEAVWEVDAIARAVLEGKHE